MRIQTLDPSLGARFRFQRTFHINLLRPFTRLCVKKFQLEVISPERVFYTGEVEMVELTTTEGDIGVYEKFPLIGIFPYPP